ncbi:MAG: hypothetical protein HFG44_09335 [Oscillospiraceae bacterium]|jgi:hypothetical protein|nr:hypothetical protein [Oscillospiraceae bacterium]
MKIPESIRIGGVEYAIKYAPNLRIGNDLCYGTISYDDSVITLSDSDGTGHQRRCITLWHEILHGIREHAGLEIENEEEIVEMFSKGIYQVLQDNGNLLFDLVPAENAIVKNNA